MSHSLACNSHMWDEQMPLLAKRFKVLRFDTRGHGGSDAPTGAYSLEQLSDDVKGLFDALGIRVGFACMRHRIRWKKKSARVYAGETPGVCGAVGGGNILVRSARFAVTWHTVSRRRAGGRQRCE